MKNENPASRLIVAVSAIIMAGCASVEPPLTQTVETPAISVAECRNVARDEGNLQKIMGWSQRTLAKAQSLSHLTPEALCALPLAARDQLRTVIRQAQKADANGMIQYLESLHRDASGKVPADGLYQSVQQHNRLLARQSPGKQTSTAEVAGITSSSWTSLGPKNTYSGRVRALHIDPRNPAIMLVGTASGGIWRSANGGSSWQAADGFSPAFSVTGLRADPGNPNTIYASTGEIFFQGAGIWRSLDNGLSWLSIPATAPGQSVPGLSGDTGMTVSQTTDVAVSPASSQIIVASTSYGGLLLSKDAGVSWKQVAPKGSYGTGANAYSRLPTTYFVSFDPKNAQKVVAGTDRGTLVVGTGVGTASEAWQEQTVAAQTADTMVAAMAWSGNGQSAWLTTSEAKGTVYRSTDGGSVFSQLSVPEYCGGQCWYNNSLWVDPVNSSRVVLGGVSLRRSADGGLTWETIDTGLNYSWNHVDHHAVMAAPGYDGATVKTVYFGNDGGVFRTTDITAPAWVGNNMPGNAFTWDNFGKGIDATQFYAVDANSTAGIILGGTQDNGTFRYQSGTDWVTLTGGDGGYPGVPGSGTPLYSSFQNLTMARTPYSATTPGWDYICDGITDSSASYKYVWNSATQHWDQQLVCGAAGQASKSLFIAPVILDLNSDKRMYAGGQSLWVSNDVSTGTPVWRAVKGPLPAGNAGSPPKVSAITVAPGDSNNVWVGYDNGEAYRTVNALATTPTWVLAYPAPNRYRQVRSIFISPLAPQRVTIAVSGYSNEPGTSSVFRSLDAGANWTNISGNLPNTVAYSVAEHPSNSSYLYVGTDTGIYASVDGVTWSASNDGPAMVPVHMLKWYNSTTLLAATHGRGLWAATVEAPAASVPVCALAASPSTITVGASATLTASCSPAATSYAWTGSGFAATVASGSVSPTASTTYSVTGSNAIGASNSASATVTVTAAPTDSARLINLSTRGQVQTGDNIMIGGFVIGGSVAKSVLIRAVGPNLANYGVTGVLANPALKLLSGQTEVASNDDWGSAANAAAIEASGKAPVSPLESAILTTLSPGTYTAQVSGADGGAGVGIIEVYEIDQAASPLINISTRGQVQTGDNVMIGGFVIGGSASQTVLIRAVGPNLANYGVTGVLANPMLQLYAGQTLIASNDDWGSAANAAAIQATGKAPANPLESAILVTLSPGTYTARVSGADGGSGVGIVEVFAQ